MSTKSRSNRSGHTHGRKKPKAARPPGRPPKHDAPEYDRALFDALVYGEPTAGADGSETIRYPSYRELATRFGLSLGALGRFASERDVLARRARAHEHGDVVRKLDPVLAGGPSSSSDISGEEVRALSRQFLQFIKQCVAEGRMRPDIAELERLKRLGDLIDAQNANQDALRPLGLPTLEQLMADIERRDREYAATAAAERGLLPIGRSYEDSADGAPYEQALDKDRSQ